jgi:predicted alpha/beta hydrolase
LGAFSNTRDGGHSLAGSQQLGFLARSYAVNIAIFLGALAAIASRGLGLGAVWSALATFQLVRLVTFVARSFSSRLLGAEPWTAAGGSRDRAEHA